MSDYGIKVSQLGYDVFTALKERLVYTSKYDTLKVFGTGNGTLEVPARIDEFTPRQGLVTIAHGMPYVPAFFVFVDNPIWTTAGRLSPYTYRPVGSTHNQASYAIDSTNLYIYFYNNTASAVTFEYRFHLFYNELT